jgi:hypothetical protein
MHLHFMYVFSSKLNVLGCYLKKMKKITQHNNINFIEGYNIHLMHFFVLVYLHLSSSSS